MNHAAPPPFQSKKSINTRVCDRLILNSKTVFQVFQACSTSDELSQSAMQWPQGRLPARSDATFRSHERGYRAPDGVRKEESAQP